MTNSPDLRCSVKRSILAVVAAMLLCGAGLAQTEQLPIEAYAALRSDTFAQFWLDPASGNLLIFDVLGKLNTKYSLGLGTTVTGSVTVRYLKGGMQQVTVLSHTTNALCWGVNSDFDPAFGYSRLAVFNGTGPAALGQGMTTVVYSRRPVGPITAGGMIDSIVSNVRCEGLLREGSGYTEGTAGFAQTTQVARFATGVPTGCPPEHDGDCFPAEKVQFKPVDQ